MKDYQTTRDAAVLPMYEFTTELATLQPPSPELAALLGALPGDQQAMDGFCRVGGRCRLARRLLRRAERRRHPGARGRQGREIRVTPAGHWQAWGTSTSRTCPCCSRTAGCCWTT
jgi:hypothetical protein